jgi:outer membrane lipoprotein SlyB
VLAVLGKLDPKDGGALGETVGESVSVGTSVGTEFGTDVGDILGAYVDDILGIHVGDLLGAFVGLLIGVTVGDATGRTEGFATGEEVGEATGEEVGEATGLIVGAADIPADPHEPICIVAQSDPAPSAVPAQFPSSVSMHNRPAIQHASLLEVGPGVGADEFTNSYWENRDTHNKAKTNRYPDNNLDKQVIPFSGSVCI